jgi:hypothetical protein
VGLALEVAVRDTAYPPVGDLPLMVRGDDVTRLRVELPPAVGLAVLVVDHGTGAPMEGALVYADELLELAGYDLQDVRRRGVLALGADAGPGWALTGADGFATLEDVRGDEIGVSCHVEGRPPAGAKASDERAPVRVVVPPALPRAALAVTVLGPAGESLPGIGVEHFAREEHLAITGADGVARFDSVPAVESGRITLEPDAFAERMHARGWMWSSAIAVSRSVTLAPGEERELTLGFVPPAADVLLEVVDPRGAPVEGVDVDLSGPVQLEATTGADGVARFEGVPEGAYTPGFAGFFGSWSSAEDIAVAPGPPVRARLVRGEARLQGRVLSELDGTTPRRVTLLAMGDSTAMTHTDAEGRFALENAPPGRLRLTAGASVDHAGVSADVVVHSGDTVVTTTLLAPPGQAARIALGPALAGARPTLRGADGSEPALWPEEGEPFVWRSPPLPAGRYTVRVAVPGGEVLEREIDVRPGVPVLVELP